MASDKPTTSLATGDKNDSLVNDKYATVPHTGDSKEGQLTKEDPQVTSNQENSDTKLKNKTPASEPLEPPAEAEDQDVEGEVYSDEEEEPPTFPYGKPRGWPSGPVVGGKPQRPNKPRPK